MPLNSDHLKKYLVTLDAALLALNNAPADSIDYDIYRNATIKCFELSLELTAKLLKKALKPYVTDVKSIEQLYFKDIFREAARHQLLSLDAVERFFTYRDNRNSTAHDYGEAFAEETLILLPAFIKDARALVECIDAQPTP